jgi:hypothetical protein
MTGSRSRLLEAIGYTNGRRPDPDAILDSLLKAGPENISKYAADLMGRFAYKKNPDARVVAAYVAIYSDSNSISGKDKEAMRRYLRDMLFFENGRAAKVAAEALLKHELADRADMVRIYDVLAG